MKGVNADSKIGDLNARKIGELIQRWVLAVTRKEL
jgi:hypothetical protein